jgi:type I restriction enzyme M protein
MNATASIVSRVWSFCTTLRDDGVGYGDYLEQLTYLIFLKMADEYGRPPYSRKIGIPGRTRLGQPEGGARGGAGGALRDGAARAGQQAGPARADFHQGAEQDSGPGQAVRLIDMVDETSWVTLGADVKGDIYEGLLERNAEDTKSGAGQYFTPRPLIRAMVECMRPVAEQDDCRSGLRHRRLLSRRLRFSGGDLPRHGQASSGPF